MEKTLRAVHLTSRVGGRATEQDHSLTFTNPHWTSSLSLEILQVCLPQHKSNKAKVIISFFMKAISTQTQQVWVFIELKKIKKCTATHICGCSIISYLVSARQVTRV